MMVNLDCQFDWIKRHLGDEVGHACEDVPRGSWLTKALTDFWIDPLVES